MTDTPSSALTNKSFKVTYSDGEVVHVKRVARNKLSDLMVLQQELLVDFMKHNAAIGVMVQDKKIWSTMVKAAAMLPVVGQDKPGIDLTRIEDDFEQLCRIFFTESMDETGELDNFRPSLISKLHHFDYGGDLGKAILLLQEDKKAEISALETVTQTSLPTSSS